MTVWDLYAAAALQGMLASLSCDRFPELAARAGNAADAMCAEREKRDNLSGESHDALTVYALTERVGQ